jgi:hypothetical protein
MTTTSTGIARDRLADMTRERDWWRREALLRLVAFAMMFLAFIAPHIERAWLAWRAEKPPVSVHVQCMDPVRVTNTPLITVPPCDPDTWRCVTVPCSLEVNECGLTRWSTP